MSWLKSFWFWVFLGLFNLFLYTLSMEFASHMMALVNMLTVVCCFLNAYRIKKYGD